MAAEFPVRAVIDDKGIDQLIAGLTRAGKVAGLSEDQIKKMTDEARRAGKDGAGGVNKLNTELDKTNKIGNLAKVAVAGIFSAVVIQRASALVLETANLAAQADKVKLSFDRLKGAEKLLQDLRRVTQGTVSDLQLMQTAVKAENFRIPLNKLASLLEFASLKASQTGQSVDYMVESIITGIGRQSLPILDNLQLSATEIREEVQKIGDFGQAVGNIVERQLSTMARASDSTYTKTARLAANMDNLKVNIGRVVNETGLLQKGLDKLNSIVEGLNDVIDDQVKHLNNEHAEINMLVTAITDVNTSQEARNTLIEELNAHYPAFLRNLDKEKVTNEELTTRLKDVNEQFQRKILLVAAQEELERVSRAIIKTVNEEADARKLLAKAQADDTKKHIAAGAQLTKASLDRMRAENDIKRALDERKVLQDELSERTKAYSEALGIFNTTNNDYFATIDKVNEKEKERIGILGRLQQRLSALKEELNLAGSEKEIARIRLEIEMVERQIKSLGSIVRNLRDPLREFADSIEKDLVKNTEDALNRMEKSLIKFSETYAKNKRDQKKIDDELNASRLAAIEYARDTEIAAFQAVLDFNTYKVEQEIALLDYQRRHELENAAGNEEAKAAINKKFEQERVKLLRKQAEREQRAALFNILVNQGPAIAETYKNMGGFPAALPFVAALGALFAVQLNTTRSVPLPRYAKGKYLIKGPGSETSDSIPALLSKNETVVTAKRSTGRFSPVVQALVEGSDQDVERAMRLQLRSDISKVHREQSSSLQRELIKANAKLARLIDKKETHISINEHGFIKWTQKGNYITNLLTRRYSTDGDG
jgi:hypothetical protein